MSTKLSVQLSSVSKTIKSEVNFQYNDLWTADAEILLMQKVREILSLIRNEGISIHFILELDVKDPDQAKTMIKKSFGQSKEIIIHNQKLTLREIEILDLIMLGYTNQQIADKIFVSYETVKTHRKHILEKTGSKNTASMIHFYHQALFGK